MRPVWLTIGIVLLVLAGALALGATVDSTRERAPLRPSFCGSCHTQALQGWESSGAAAEHGSCLECHVGPGVLGAVRTGLASAYNLTAYSLGADPNAARAQLPSSNCTQCHTDSAALRQLHHNTLPVRSTVGSCLACHGETSLFTIPTCGVCHSHNQETSFKGSQHPLPR